MESDRSADRHQRVLRTIGVTLQLLAVGAFAWAARTFASFFGREPGTELAIWDVVFLLMALWVGCWLFSQGKQTRNKASICSLLQLHSTLETVMPACILVALFLPYKPVLSLLFAYKPVLLEYALAYAWGLCSIAIAYLVSLAVWPAFSRWLLVTVTMEDPIPPLLRRMLWIAAVGKSYRTFGYMGAFVLFIVAFHARTKSHPAWWMLVALLVGAFLIFVPPAIWMRVHAHESGKVDREELRRQLAECGLDSCKTGLGETEANAPEAEDVRDPEDSGDE